MKPHTALRRQDASRSGRCGAALVSAIVALIVTAGILFAMLKSAVEVQREIRYQRYQLQADALATAGMERAIAALQASGEYRGETWRVKAADLSGDDAAAVSIQFQPVGDNPSDLRVVVEAQFPADADQRAQRTLEAIIHRNSP